ncbi:hypothetical protein SprV_0702317200 [Sparganum proliferum]
MDSTQCVTNDGYNDVRLLLSLLAYDIFGAKEPALWTGVAEQYYPNCEPRVAPRCIIPVGSAGHVDVRCAPNPIALPRINASYNYVVNIHFS